MHRGTSWRAHGLTHHEAARAILWGTLTLLFGLTTACVNAADSDPGLLRETPGGLPTPTPFQPQAGEYRSPFSSPAPTDAPPSANLLPYIFVEGSPYATPTAAFTETGRPLTFVLPTGINPLTGLPPSDLSHLDRRPIAIKITNFPRYIRPQSGLSLADVVFEYYIEDGLTRFIAIFYGNDAERAGPVRSGRYFDEHVVRMYQAYFVFKYADARELDYFENSDLSAFLVTPTIGACPPYFVGKNGIDTYNNVFFDTARFQDCLSRSDAENSRPALRIGFFSERTPQVDALAVRIYMDYSPDDYNYWQYQPETQNYVRYQDTDDRREGKAPSYALLTDALTGEPVSTENLVVLFVPHTFANPFDEEDEVFHIDLIKSGAAFVFRDGLAVLGRWYRTDPDQPLLLTTAIGTPVYLRPGRTFFQVIGESSTYRSEGAEWFFDFETP